MLERYNGLLGVTLGSMLHPLGARGQNVKLTHYPTYGANHHLAVAEVIAARGSATHYPATCGERHLRFFPLPFFFPQNGAAGWKRATQDFFFKRLRPSSPNPTSTKLAGSGTGLICSVQTWGAPSQFREAGPE